MKFSVLAIVLSLGLSTMVAHAVVPAATPTVAAGVRLSRAQEASSPSKADCLKCHTYEDVITATAAYATSSGEKVNPHRYIEAGSIKEPASRPHQVTGAEHIPECTNCHTAHPVPPTGPVDRSKINVEWCYSSCHHQNDFMRCGMCHQN